MICCQSNTIRNLINKYCYCLFYSNCKIIPSIMNTVQLTTYENGIQKYTNFVDSVDFFSSVEKNYIQDIAKFELS